MATLATVRMQYHAGAQSARILLEVEYLIASEPGSYRQAWLQDQSQIQCLQTLAERGQALTESLSQNGSGCASGLKLFPET